MKRLALVIVALVIAGTLSISAGQRADAAGTATLTLHVRLCPLGQPTTDLFTDCHPYPAPRGDRFDVEGGGSKKIGLDGNTSFGGLSAGTHLVKQTGGQFANEFLHERVFCSTNGGAANEIDVVPGGDFWVSLTAGQKTTCDIYFIPESGR